MKKILLIIGLGSLIAVSCSSSRTGYTYFDDVYNHRPSYSQEKRRVTGYSDDRPTYQPSPTSPSNYTSPESYENNSGSRRYLDDENYSDYGTYTERIRRFERPNYGFDYYSPYYTGFNSGFNYGIGIGSGLGYSMFGNYGSSFWNPWYSSSFYFGWGRPSWNIGFNTWYSPSYFDPFYSYNNWGWGNWYSPYYSSWYPSWGWGGHHNHHNDYQPFKNNMYYGPRGSSYGNSYYNGSQFDGGKTGINRGHQNYSSPSVNPNSGSGNFKYTPKSYSTPNVPFPSNQDGKNKAQPQPNKNNVPDRYKNAVPDRYMNTPERNSPNRGGSFGGSQDKGSSPGRSNQSQPSQKSGGSMQRTNK
ncbi:MAG: hypothetical protein LC105_10465 [Chitinophagales bacterium]|nr:hypothetical protein [Chitinophagales bacterium]MCZ2394271.1 hypothetical protein [Chitinophagales bacterium]